MANYWEIELSGIGLHDGIRIAIPKDKEWPPDEYHLLRAPEIVTIWEDPPTIMSDDHLRFQMHHRRDDGVLVYREKMVCPHCGNDRDSYKCKCGQS